MRKFHVVITDNETGEVHCDTHTDAIMAGIDQGETVRGLNLTSCDAFTMASVIDVMQDVIKDNLNTHPELAGLLLLAAKENETKIENE